MRAAAAAVLLHSQKLVTARARLAFARGQVGKAAELLAQLPESATRYVRRLLRAVSPGDAPQLSALMACPRWQLRFAFSQLLSALVSRLSQLKKRHTPEGKFSVLVEGKVRSDAMWHPRFARWLPAVEPCSVLRCCS